TRAGQAPARGGGGSRIEFRRGLGASGAGLGKRAPSHRLLGQRQSHQGRRRAGDSIDESDARARRANDARGYRPVALDSPVVVKVGGEIARSRDLPALARNLVALRSAGRSVVVVHGGGPQVTELQAKLGQKANIVAGRRVTDASALEVLKMVVAGVVNVD